MQRSTYHVLAVLLLLLLPGSITAWLPPPTDTAYIVQAATTDDAAAAVEQAGGTVTRHLGIINGVSARLDSAAQARLRANPNVVLHADSTVHTSDETEEIDDTIDSASIRETYTRGFKLYPAAATGAHLVHSQTAPTLTTACSTSGVTVGSSTTNRSVRGWGTTVAVVDTGLSPMWNYWNWELATQTTNTVIAERSGQCIIYHDLLSPLGSTPNSQDPYGHGTHVASTIIDNRATSLAIIRPATHVGVAPDTNTVIVRALGADGSGSYTDVIAAIDWIVSNKDIYNIHVLNLSLYAPVVDYYWEDPLNQAVMRAWQTGITVVTVAGNTGPDAGTITAPGNVPYVITVGAVKSGRYTASGLDELADYSARGPTESAFVKPDIVIPASRTIAPMPNDSYLAQLVQAGRLYLLGKADYYVIAPELDHDYYQLSGTSMAAAEVSGVVSLILQANPTLTNNQVKYRLQSTARVARDETTGEPIYSVWEQGAGLVDVEQAVFTTTVEAANVGMDIAIDLDPNSTEHYWGHTIWDESSGEFRLVDFTTGDPLETWAGGRRSSSGSTWLWAGGRRSSSGSSETWAGGRRSSSGSSLSWAGSDRPWMQTGLQSTFGDMITELVVDEDEVFTMAEDEAQAFQDESADETQPPDDKALQALHPVWLPVVIRMQ